MTTNVLLYPGALFQVKGKGVPWFEWTWSLEVLVSCTVHCVLKSLVLWLQQAGNMDGLLPLLWEDLFHANWLWRWTSWFTASHRLDGCLSKIFLVSKKPWWHSVVLLDTLHQLEDHWPIVGWRLQRCQAWFRRCRHWCFGDWCWN